MMRNKIARLIATCFFVGYTPYCPGTVASALTAIIYFFVPDFSSLGLLFSIVIAMPVSIWAASRVEWLIGYKDPSSIVIDEFVGMLIALIALPKTWWAYLLAFILFRIFDIAKPFPIRQVEKYLPGGIGIVMDDVLAGMMARALLCAILAFMG